MSGDDDFIVERARRGAAVSRPVMQWTEQRPTVEPGKVWVGPASWYVAELPDDGAYAVYPWRWGYQVQRITGSGERVDIAGPGDMGLFRTLSAAKAAAEKDRRATEAVGGQDDRSVAVGAQRRAGAGMSDTPLPGPALRRYFAILATMPHGLDTEAIRTFMADAAVAARQDTAAVTVTGDGPIFSDAPMSAEHEARLRMQAERYAWQRERRRETVQAQTERTRYAPHLWRPLPRAAVAGTATGAFGVTTRTGQQPAGRARTRRHVRSRRRRRSRHSEAPGQRKGQP